MTNEEALSKLLSSKNYRDICPDTVKKEFELQLTKHKNPAEAEKAARERLHAVTGAFMTASELKSARACLERYAAGEEAALWDALKLHSSTRERLDDMEELYGRIFAFAGRPQSCFDAACGLNPLYLGHVGGMRVLGADIHGGAVALINDWASHCGQSVSALCMDLSIDVPGENFDLALAMKLLPVLETAEKGGALRFLDRVNAKHFCVTFPTRTLGGRNAGMEKHYSEWFENEIKDKYTVHERFTLGSELVYLLTR